MFVKDDELKYKAFKVVLHKANFEVKGEAAIAVASLFQWFNSLEEKIKKAVAEPQIKPIKPKNSRKTISDNKPGS